MPMHIWLLTNTPSSYQVEFLSAIHEDGRHALDVRFMSTVHRGTSWKPENTPFPCSELPGFGPRVWSDAFRYHPQAVRECREGEHDLFVLSGQYTSLTFLACARELQRRRKPWVLWLEAPWPDDYRPAWSRHLSARSGLVRVFRRRALASLLVEAHGVFCIGSMARDAYAAMGAPFSRLFQLPYHCDMRRFRDVPEDAIRRVRERFGIGQEIVFLCAGQMIERKGVDVLLEAFQQIAGDCPDTALLLVGDGPLLGELQSSVPPTLVNRVQFAGGVSYEELPAHFRAADAFVLPTRHDGWGVVLNEACAAGLPIISTNAAGAARDMVTEGHNGFLVDRDDVSGLADHLVTLARRPEMRSAFGEHALTIAEQFSLEAGVNSFHEHVEVVLAGHME